MNRRSEKSSRGVHAAPASPISDRLSLSKHKTLETKTLRKENLDA
jgi:hypothetical protein